MVGNITCLSMTRNAVLALMVCAKKHWLYLLRAQPHSVALAQYFGSEKQGGRNFLCTYYKGMAKFCRWHCLFDVVDMVKEQEDVYVGQTPNAQSLNGDENLQMHEWDCITENTFIRCWSKTHLSGRGSSLGDRFGSCGCYFYFPTRTFLPNLWNKHFLMDCKRCMCVGHLVLDFLSFFFFSLPLATFFMIWINWENWVRLTLHK